MKLWRVESRLGGEGDSGRIPQRLSHVLARYGAASLRARAAVGDHRWRLAFTAARERDSGIAVAAAAGDVRHVLQFSERSGGVVRAVEAPRAMAERRCAAAG